MSKKSLLDVIACDGDGDGDEECVAGGGVSLPLSGRERGSLRQPRVPTILTLTFSGISFCDSTCSPGLNTRA